MKWFLEPESNFPGAVSMPRTRCSFFVTTLKSLYFHAPAMTDFFHCWFSRFPTEIVISVDLD